MRRILAVLLENEAGALSRVVGLFAQRNYNIESLTVAPTEDLTLSRLTITTVGDATRRQAAVVVGTVAVVAFLTQLDKTVAANGRLVGARIRTPITDV